ncbi:alpha/beta-hydrolase [Jackrogersella minutella]|nr:alpha/beta-hydrolase [Jackrogersella minutella]
MPKPSILFIPGSFAIPELYSNIFDAVTAKGYEIKGLHLPSVGLKTGPRKEPPATIYDDAAFIAKEVENLADDGRDVMLIGHSYGGIPITQCTQGLTKAERQKEGKKGGIVRLAYMTALVPAPGQSGLKFLETLPAEHSAEYGLDDKGYLYFDDVPKAALLTFSDVVDQTERVALVEKFQVHSSVSFANELTHAGYKDVPVSYLFCEIDQCVLPRLQKDGIDTIEKESGNKVDVTYVNAGHCPTATATQETVDWIVQAAAKHEAV